MTIKAANSDTIAEAAALLRAGDVVAFPTETVYGLGADATNATAVAKVFAAKQRPSFNPLITHTHDVQALQGEVLFDSRAQELAAQFWPGPLTLVLPKGPCSRIASITHADLPAVAVRVPNHPVAYGVLKAFAETGSGLIAAPSANRSNSLSPTTAAHVAESLGDSVPLILAGGKSTVGLESTVVDLTISTARILRHGGVTAEDIERLIGPCERAQPGETPVAPGMMSTHYAPRQTMRLNALTANDDEAFLMFGPVLGTNGGNTGGKLRLNLSESGDLIEAAANLFDYLHQLQNSGVSQIAVMPIPDHGLGVAINDRLSRGAAGQSA